MQIESQLAYYLQIQVKAFIQMFAIANGLQKRRCAASTDTSEGKVQPYKLLVVGRERPNQLLGHQLASTVSQQRPLQ